MLFFCKIGTAILTVFLATGFVAAQAQDWTNVTADSARTRTPYFLDTSIGFMFNAGIFNPDGISLNESNSSPNLVKTTDGGITWQYLPFFDSIGCSITQLCFVSLDHGYASTCGGMNSINSGIYETTNQGADWKRITPVGFAFTGVYASDGTIFASEIITAHFANKDNYYGLTGGILYTHDDGSKWDSVSDVAGISPNIEPQFQLIYGNRDSLVATVYFDDSSYRNSGENTYLVFSTDLGQSWYSSLLDSDYQYPIVTLHLSPHTCSILRLYDDSNDYYSYRCQFLEASPPYKKWDAGLVDFPTGSWVSGNACAMYVSEYEKSVVKPPPFQRSTDNGYNWSGVGSPELPWDEFNAFDYDSWQNLSVVGYGAVVFATNAYNKLIKTTDGGDGALSVSALAPRLAFGRSSFASGTDTLTMTQCSPSSMFFYYQNLSCAFTTLDNVSIDGLDPSEYSWSVTHHNDCLSLPDTVYVFLHPSDTGIYSLTLNAHFIDDEYQTSDENSHFTLRVAPGSQQVPLRLEVKSSTISTASGDTIDIPVYLSGTASLDSIFLSLPFGLDTNMLRPIGFHPLIAGLTNDTLSYSNGMVIVPLRANGLAVNGEIEIGSLRCVVYLSDTLESTVTFSSANLSAVNIPCIALSVSADSITITISGCGYRTLLQFLKSDSLPISILSIVPNPATSSVQVALSEAPSSAILYQVVDALGERRMSGTATSNTVSFDVSSLPQGVYYFRAKTAGGMQMGKQFVILR